MDKDAALPVIDWLTTAALGGAREHTLLEGLCDRLVAQGLPLMRAAMGSDLLHPTLDSRGYWWVRGDGVAGQDFARDDPLSDRDEWRRSPFFYMLEHRLPRLRCRLAEPRWTAAFPLLARFASEGATDYVAFAVGLGEAARLGAVEGMVCSWTIDRPGGYRDEEIALLARVVPVLAVCVHLAGSIGTARTLLNTYLGRDAAERVLKGNIVRGRAETIRAVIWYSDLAGFTRISDSIERDHILGLLNDYAECLVEVIEAHGGDVLKFMGDGILAIFPDDARSQACGRSLGAALEAEVRLAALNERRWNEGTAITDVYLALHVGDLLYGNFGSRSRLDFTVLGPTVNEASRISAMCRSLDQRIIVSSAFAAAAGRGRDWLVSLGRYALRGIGRPQELFTIDREAAHRGKDA